MPYVVNLTQIANGVTNAKRVRMVIMMIPVVYVGSEAGTTISLNAIIESGIVYCTALMISVRPSDSEKCLCCPMATTCNFVCRYLG